MSIESILHNCLHLHIIIFIYLLFVIKKKTASLSLRLLLQPDYTIQSVTGYALFILLVWLMLKLPTRTTTHPYLSQTKKQQKCSLVVLWGRKPSFTLLLKIRDFFVCGCFHDVVMLTLQCRTFI